VLGNVCCQLLDEHTTITVFQIYPYERLVVKHFQLPPDVDRTCLEVSFFVLYALCANTVIEISCRH
jgi:hypothetical protein